MLAALFTSPTARKEHLLEPIEPPRLIFRDKQASTEALGNLLASYGWTYCPQHGPEDSIALNLSGEEFNELLDLFQDIRAELMSFWDQDA